MVRYIRQRNDYECGPIGMANVLKWAGFRFGYADFRRDLMEYCGCKPGIGSETFSPAQGLRTMSEGAIKVRFVKRIRIAAIDRHLISGGAVLLACHNGTDEDDDIPGHISLCIGKDGDYYDIVNHIGFETVVKWPRPMLIRDLRRRKGGWPGVWLLRRN